LAVDDEPAILRVLRLCLAELGCQTVTATSAEDALQMMDQIRPHVVITDIRLPGMDGLELARRIKADSRLAGTAVLVISAHGEPRNNPGDYFIPKPFMPEELIERVRACFDRCISGGGSCP
jgi:two-component system phosphate regulon response regulator PhoB